MKIVNIFTIIVSIISAYGSFRILYVSEYIVSGKYNIKSALIYSLLLFPIYLFIMLFSENYLRVLFFFLNIMIVPYLSFRYIKSNTLTVGIVLYFIVQMLAAYEIGMIICADLKIHSIIGNNFFIMHIDETSLMLTNIYIIFVSFFIVKSNIIKEKIILVNKRIQVIFDLVLFLLGIYTIIVSNCFEIGLKIEWLNVVVILLMIGVILVIYEMIELVYIYYINRNKHKLIIAKTSQIQNQAVEYRYFEKYNESLRIFRHDYKKMMKAVKLMLDEKHYEEIGSLLDGIELKMNDEVEINKSQYQSENYIYNSLYRCLKNLCDRNNIKLTGEIYIPHTELNMDYISMFEILFNFFLFINNKSKNIDKRKIELETVKTDVGVRLLYKSYYGGNLYVGYDGSLSGNAVKNHQEDLNMFEQAIERNMGNCNYYVDWYNNILTVEVNIPYKGGNLK